MNRGRAWSAIRINPDPYASCRCSNDWLNRLGPGDEAMEPSMSPSPSHPPLAGRASATSKCSRPPRRIHGSRQPHLLHGAVVDFDAAATELELAHVLPETVEAAAADVAAHDTAARADYTVATDLTLVHPGRPAPSRGDLDQAFALERKGDGSRCCYAIADVAVVRCPQWRRRRCRGVRAVARPLLPRPLDPAPHRVEPQRGAREPVAEEHRPVALWRIDLDGEGEIGGRRVRCAVASCEPVALSYDGLTDLLPHPQGTPTAATRSSSAGRSTWRPGTCSCRWSPAWPRPTS